MANARAWASTWGTRPPSLNFRDYWAQEERFARLAGSRWSAALPHSTGVVLRDSGDFRHIETPEEFTAEVTTFVAAQDAAP